MNSTNLMLAGSLALCSLFGSEARAQKGAELLVRPNAIRIIERSRLAIASQLDPRNTANLSRSEMAPRFNRVLFYLQEAKKAGAEPSELIGEALKLIPADKGMAEFYWDPNMVRDQVLDAFATCQEWRVFGSRSNLEKLKHGNSATIQAGDFAGETVEFDHRIPVSQAPELQNNFTGIP